MVLATTSCVYEIHLHIEGDAVQKRDRMMGSNSLLSYRFDAQIVSIDAPTFV